MTRKRFSADEMLGSLARWLRLMGYDTRYERDSSDTEILERARVEGRVLLTRDKKLAERAKEQGLYIDVRDLDDQIRQVITVFGLKFLEDLSRCTACNGELMLISREEASKGVPEGALQSNEQFYRCRSCGKYYWKGSHWKNIQKKMETLFRPDQDSSR
jgi:uncharacterized protein with PIN domain